MEGEAVVKSESEEVEKLQSEHNFVCKEEPDLEISSPLQNLFLKSAQEEQMVILKEECKPLNNVGRKIEDEAEIIKQELVNAKISVTSTPSVETIPIANLQKDLKHGITVEDHSHAKQNAPQTDTSFGSITKLKTTDCPICSEVFRTFRELRIHLYAHKKEDQVSCLICGMSFSTQRSLTIHATIHAERISLACSVCDLTLNDKMELEQHWATHPVKAPFSCSLCSEVKYSTKSKLQRHFRKVHIGMNPTCKPDEDYSFIVVYKGRLRIRRLFHCKDCPKLYTKSYRLGAHYINDHIQKNTMAIEYACRECSKPYYKISRLADHYQRTHF